MPWIFNGVVTVIWPWTAVPRNADYTTLNIAGNLRRLVRQETHHWGTITTRAYSSNIITIFVYVNIVSV